MQTYLKNNLSALNFSAIATKILLKKQAVNNDKNIVIQKLRDTVKQQEAEIKHLKNALKTQDTASVNEAGKMLDVICLDDSTDSSGEI
jgi:hypothetical protein